MGIETSWGLRIGRMAPGPRNLITDVEGVTVGHCTVAGDPQGAQTGVTAVLPHQGNLFQHKVPAAVEVINGFGKSVGLVQIQELGTLETPLLLTNTLSVGTVSTALVKHMLARNPDIGTTTGTVNPVVFECNDGRINDIRGLHIRESHAEQALASCGPRFAEGAVGAGRGMRCHELKGGIGSASRRFRVDGVSYTLGALVLSNQGLKQDLLVSGDPVGQRLIGPRHEHDDALDTPEQGSIIIILATDAPLTERQLGRVAARASDGLARTGSFFGNGSGDIALAFSTAYTIPHYPPPGLQQIPRLHEDHIDTLFRAAAETTEEAVLSSLLHAEPVTARDGATVTSLADLLPPGAPAHS